jgi:hypothetical protein
VLVTGVPRSGTTWLARELAGSPGTSLTGREPMNPRGHQYGLGGSLHGWSRLTVLTRRQRLVLLSAYRGLNPFVYSRYGHRQWAAPWPGTRVVVKDPFALLSIPAVRSATGAVPVLIYRHPAAVLASYRRMGWTADLDEVAAALGQTPTPCPEQFQETSGADDAWAMAQFWSLLHAQALEDLAALDVGVIVSHEAVATGGAAAMRTLFERLGLAWDPSAASARPADGERRAADPQALHNLDRAPETVASSWRSRVSPEELEIVELAAGPTLREMEERSMELS